MMPNLVIMVPKDENELQHMLKTSLEYAGPSSLRYPRGSGLGVPLDQNLEALPIGRSERLRQGRDLDIWAVGTMVWSALQVAELLDHQYHLTAGVVNARFVKPLDEQALLEVSARVPLIATLEENAIAGGFGEGVLACLNSRNRVAQCHVLNLGIPDEFVPHGKRDLLLKDLGLDPAGAAARIAEEYHSLQKEKAEP